MNNITLYLDKLVKYTGLPLWGILIISVFIIFFVYLYGILTPLSVRRIKKEMINMNHKLGLLAGGHNINNRKNESTTYRWKS
jgi:hypothetical protein